MTRVGFEEKNKEILLKFLVGKYAIKQFFIVKKDMT